MEAFMIHCTTGCTCCSNKNHYCGPFSTRKIAEEYEGRFRSSKKLASQYAPNGHYHISEHLAEVLPDGRVIIDCHIFPGWADENGWDEIPYDPSLPMRLLLGVARHSGPALRYRCRRYTQPFH